MDHAKAWPAKHVSDKPPGEYGLVSNKIEVLDPDTYGRLLAPR
jgi:hypothetical protein